MAMLLLSCSRAATYLLVGFEMGEGGEGGKRKGAGKMGRRRGKL